MFVLKVDTDGPDVLGLEWRLSGKMPYVCGQPIDVFAEMVNLTTLAPDIVAAILDETLPPEVTLFDLASGTPLLLEEQRKRMGRC